MPTEQRRTRSSGSRPGYAFPAGYANNMNQYFKDLQADAGLEHEHLRQRHAVLLDRTSTGTKTFVQNHVTFAGTTIDTNPLPALDPVNCPDTPVAARRWRQRQPVHDGRLRHRRAGAAGDLERRQGQGLAGEQQHRVLHVHRAEHRHVLPGAGRRGHGSRSRHDRHRAALLVLVLLRVPQLRTSTRRSTRTRRSSTRTCRTPRRRPATRSRATSGTTRTTTRRILRSASTSHEQQRVDHRPVRHRLVGQQLERQRRRRGERRHVRVRLRDDAPGRRTRSATRRSTATTTSCSSSGTTARNGCPGSDATGNPTSHPNYDTPADRPHAEHRLRRTAPFKIFGQFFAAGDAVSSTFADAGVTTALGSATANASGHFSRTTKVPADARRRAPPP